jgi:hypothetical protein
MSTSNGKKTIRQQLDEGAVLKALEVGSKRAVRTHKLLGNPVSTVREGRVVLVPPEEIQVDELRATGQTDAP